MIRPKSRTLLTLIAGVLFLSAPGSPGVEMCSARDRLVLEPNPALLITLLRIEMAQQELFAIRGQCGMVVEGEEGNCYDDMEEAELAGASPAEIRAISARCIKEIKKHTKRFKKEFKAGQKALVVALDAAGASDDQLRSFREFADQVSMDIDADTARSISNVKRKAENLAGR